MKTSFLIKTILVGTFVLQLSLNAGGSSTQQFSPTELSLINQQINIAMATLGAQSRESQLQMRPVAAVVLPPELQKQFWGIIYNPSGGKLASTQITSPVISKFIEALAIGLPDALQTKLWGKVLYSKVTEESKRQTRLNKRYDHTCFLMAHNGYSAEQAGFIYANQYYDLKGQLERGVRAFELDTYHRCWDKGLGIFGSSGCTVSLCHGSCEITKWIQPKKGLTSGLFEETGDPAGFKGALETVKDFLLKNPDEVVSVFLENSATAPGKKAGELGELDKKFEEAQVQNMVLKPTDWDPIAQQGWPTIAKLKELGKRIVVFNSKSSETHQYPTSLSFQSTKYTYYRWICTLETQYSTLDIEKAAKERGESAGAVENYTRYLYVLDYFPEGGKILGGGISDVIKKIGGSEVPFGGNYKQVNGPDLERFLNRVVTKGLENGMYKGRYPNFIQVDYFHEGNPLALVNKINEMANDPQKRAQMFRPLFKTEEELNFQKGMESGGFAALGKLFQPVR